MTTHHDDDRPAADASQAAPLSGIPAERKASLLSGRNFWETEALEEAGIAAIAMADGPYGLRHQSGHHDNLALFESDKATCFPPGVAIGSSWDPAMAARLGTALGKEAAAQGVDVVLGPGVNIKRSPLCGRNFEYYSEDPHLSGVLGAAFTRALQAEGPGASVKHFAANNQETNRQTISSDVDERTLREIYLPAFEHIVTEARPATVMASYNKINGVSASENRWLLTEVLRGEWGFEGVVVSDWSAVTDRVAALKAGLDLEMPGGDMGHDEDVLTALRSGEVSESHVDASVARIAALARRKVTSAAAVDYEEHHRIARQIAQECAVLLRNEDQVLPIPGGVHVAVIGAFAEHPRYQGGGSAHVNATRVDRPIDEIRTIAAEVGATVGYTPGFVLDGPRDERLVSDAIAAARSADIAVVFAGLSEQRESEGFDRDTIDLPPAQVELIREVAAAAHRTVVVLANGGIVSLEGWHDDVHAILEGFLLGQGGGHAVADILFGRVNPSGHLAESIPIRLQDHPSWLNFPGEQGHVRYGEGVLVGYRYFSTAGTPVRYPFGHGLSYTTFETRALRVTRKGADSATAEVVVTNTGTRAGKHVVQVYVATEAGPVRRPLRELRGFAKVRLDPGETATVEIDLPRRAFAYWDVRVGRWAVAPGDYRIEVCADANTVLRSSTLTLQGERIATELTMDTPVGAWFEHPGVGSKVMDALGLTGAPITEEQMAMIASMTMRQFIGISGLDVSTDALRSLMAASRPA
ncbi:beta-glucosidase [Thermocatellispora tengchongensis]|uniref:Exo-alpha-(1->6)-L-arabinopyranosidase n=1 Tax=Thermocatellispora tengchongensis TaxID=1073253 RepID=A0A840PLI7_9ACTN|nr:glycoside hydrolase family 3 C-terminal domain-containing protein [Thermocatellispora tengchongensis]MBB5139809.1 beta-glucosidase [Thermocatellispora tengchongensis]